MTGVALSKLVLRAVSVYLLLVVIGRAWDAWDGNPRAGGMWRWLFAPLIGAAAGAVAGLVILAAVWAWGS